MPVPTPTAVPVRDLRLTNIEDFTVFSDGVNRRRKAVNEAYSRDYGVLWKIRESVMQGPIFDNLNSRVRADLADGDVAYFTTLTVQLEYITKLVTAGVVACIGDDSERHRYTLEHALVRADSLGDWVKALDSALTGPAAQLFIPASADVIRNFTERVPEGDWRFAAVTSLHEAARILNLESHIGTKVSLRQLFQIGAMIRNRTRGHGATTSGQCGLLAPYLANATESLIAYTALFKLPWAHLHRNLSGKYRVTPLLGDCSPFDYLKRTRDTALQNGVHIYLAGPVHVPLIYSDSELLDILVPNGNYKAQSFEVLSYVTNEIKRKDGNQWSEPPGPLPASETQGRSALEQVGNLFSNVPPTPAGHIPRASLESRVFQELLKAERHPIVSLTGPGGIGKTTLAIAAIEQMAKMEKPPYDVILWMSARDIDLLESGPKPVSPRVVRKEDISRAAVELLEPADRNRKDFKHVEYFQIILAAGAAGRTLFVFDNFETLESPADVFAWLDTYVRSPNKVLITTRSRDFSGDFPMEIGGMTDDEAIKLIDQESKRLGITQLLNRGYVDELIDAYDGHPYVIKIVLGQIAKERKAIKPERVVVSAEHVLDALFERAYESLSPAAQRVFLLLCSWRVFVPAIAVEAVSLRPDNERFDVSSALSELKNFSLVEELLSPVDKEVFVGVPLVATSYGRRKLAISPYKVAVEEDRKLLMEFGAGKREDAYRGVLPRIDRLVRVVASIASENAQSITGFVPILEYLASRIPSVYLRLADLVLEVPGYDDAIERAKNYIRRFLERSETHEKSRAWLKLADLCQSSNDALSEVHALSEAALLPTVSIEEMAILVNRINNRVRDMRVRRIQESRSPEVALLIERLAIAMERHLAQMSATDCSRLAWLYLNVGKEERARDIAKKGIEREPSNEHCLNLLRKIGQ